MFLGKFCAWLLKQTAQINGFIVERGKKDRKQQGARTPDTCPMWG